MVRAPSVLRDSSPGDPLPVDSRILAVGPSPARTGVREPQLSGVVLCGGRSRRMGCDKALVAMGEHTLLERAIATLSEIASSVSLACGADLRYAEFGLPLLTDRYSAVGPLAGLEVALGDGIGEWRVVLACDMPRVRARDLARLFDHARSRDLDACLFETERGLEPLCAVYRTTCLASVRAALDAGERKVTHLFDHPTASGSRPRVESLRAAGELAASLVNVNAPEDLARAAEALS